jgi:hypothetical protein
MNPYWDMPASGWSHDLKMPALDDLETIQRDAAHEVERRAALALGVDAEVLAEAAHDVYGCSFVEKRDDLVSRLIFDDDPRSPRALRGQATRQLVGELREHLATKAASRTRKSRSGGARRKR